MSKESEISKFKKAVHNEESILKDEIKKEEKGLKWFFKSHTFKVIFSTIIFIILIGVILYLANSSGRVYIEKSEISSPVITLSPATPGVLQKIFVKEGDIIPADTIVAQVNNIPIKSEIDGLVIKIQNTPGQLVSSQTPIVQMIDTHESRVVGHIEENKGLKDIKEGQKVIFTVDAFDSKKYEGIVESISPAPDNSDIVFSISGNREEKQFNVKVKYDISSYPELKQGMSAKMWVYK